MIIITSWRVIDHFVEEHLGRRLETTTHDRDFLRQHGIHVYSRTSSSNGWRPFAILDYDDPHFALALEFEDPHKELLFGLKYL